MKGAITICMLLGAALARPDGYFQQHYQYKSSSSSYRNNELEHKNDDEGYYSRHGDLEGNTEPKVNSYSQHSEYKNPKFQGHGQNQALLNDDFYTQQTAGYRGGSSSSLNSGLSGYNGQHGSSASSIKTSGYSSSASFGTAGSSSSSSLYPTQQLAILTQQLQDDLSKQLQNAIHTEKQRHSSSSYSSYGSTAGSGNYASGVNMQLLEQQLRSNLTRQLQQALQQQYGRQSQSGSHYYTISSSGMPNTQPNYSSEELERLRQQLESNLIRQLQQGIQTQGLHASQSSSSSSITSFGTGYGHTGTNYQPEITTAHTIHLTPGSHNTNSFSTHSSYGDNRRTSGTQYVQRIPLTDITQELERDLIIQLNQALVEKMQQYRQHSYSATSDWYPDYQSDLQTLTDDLKRNLTQQLNNELVKHYGSQQQHGSGSPYRTEELNNLKYQLQDKLIRELQEKFRQQYTQYTQTAYNSGSVHHGSSSYQQPASGTHRTYSPYDSSSTHNQYKTTGTSGSYSSSYPSGTNSNSQNSYKVVGYASQSGYEFTPGTFVITSDAPAELKDITKDIHTDLSRQLQIALAEQQRRYQQHGSYSSSTGYNSPQDYQLTLQQLTDELKRNVTQQLQQSIAQHYGRQGQRGSYYYTVSSGGNYNPSPNYNAQQLNDLTQQLQNQLIQQLQQGLSYSYQSSSSSSSSSKYQGSHSGLTGTSYSSGGYNPTYSHVGGLQKYGQYSHDHSAYTGSLTGDDCDGMQGDDGFTYQNQHDLTQTVDQENVDIFNKKKIENQDQMPQLYSQAQEGGQQKIDSHEDLTQQSEHEFGQLQIGGQQKMDDFQQQYDDTQQVEGKFEQLQIGSLEKFKHHGDQAQSQTEFEQIQTGQQKAIDYDDLGSYLTEQQKELIRQMQQGTGHTDLTQQIEQQTGNYGTGQEQIDVTHQETVDFSHQNQEKHRGNLQFGGQQQVEDSQEFFQQNEDRNVGLQVNNQQKQAEIIGQQTDLTQQTEDGYGKLQIGNQHQQHIDATQHEDMTQQTEDSYGKLQIGNQHQQQQIDVGQHEDLTQQTEDIYGKLQIGNQQQQFDVGQHEDLIQQTEDGYGKLQIGNQQQQQIDTAQHEDLMQQNEDGYGKLQIGNLEHQTAVNDKKLNEDTQQIEEGFGKLQIGQLGQQVDITQHQRDSTEDLVQQTDDTNQKLAKLELIQQQQSENDYKLHQNYGEQTGLNQQHLTQQIEDGFSKLQIGNQEQQAQFELTQQVEENHGKLQFANQQQNQFDQSEQLQFGGQKQTDWTQQNEDGFEHLNRFEDQRDKQLNHNQHQLSQSSYQSSASHQQQTSYSSQYQHRSHSSRQSNLHHQQIHFGQPQVLEDKFETTGNLELQNAEKQNAQLIEHLSQHAEHQQIEGENDQLIASLGRLSHKQQNIAYEQHTAHSSSQPQLHYDQVSTTVLPETTQQGFWSKIGSKIEGTYTSAKQKAGTLIDKISTSVG